VIVELILLILAVALFFATPGVPDEAIPLALLVLDLLLGGKKGRGGGSRWLAR